MLSLRMLITLPALLSSIALAVAVPDPVVTPGPRVRRAGIGDGQDVYFNNDFIGYYTTPGKATWDYTTCYTGGMFSWYSIAVSSATSVQYWGGCYENEYYASFFTSCSGHTIFGLSIFSYATSFSTFQTTSSCAFSCVYDSLVGTLGAGTTYLLVTCPSSSRLARTYIRTSSVSLPEITGATAALTSTPLPSSTNPITGSTPTAPFVGTTASPPPTSTPKNKEKPVAAIVGGVLGGILFLALAGFLGFFIWWKKRRSSSPFNPVHSQPIMTEGPHGLEDPTFGNGYYASPPQRLATSPAISETSPPTTYGGQHGWGNAQPQHGVGSPPQSGYQSLSPQPQALGRESWGGQQQSSELIQSASGHGSP